MDDNQGRGAGEDLQVGLLVHQPIWMNSSIPHRLRTLLRMMEFSYPRRSRVSEDVQVIREARSFLLPRSQLLYPHSLA